MKELLIKIENLRKEITLLKMRIETLEKKVNV